MPMYITKFCAKLQLFLRNKENFCNFVHMNMDKRQLRKHIAALKASHTPSSLRQESERIIEHILTMQRVMQADCILLYWSLPDEVYTHELIDALASKGKTVILPKVCGETELSLHPYTSRTDLQRGAFGIMEPRTPALTAEEAEALLTSDSVGIIPGVAFSNDGYRLGRGKGYYDRLLASYPTLYKIGLCYDFQMVQSIPHDEHDIRMDEVVWQA